MMGAHDHTMPELRIGKASDIAAERAKRAKQDRHPLESHCVTNIAVRSDDVPAFLGIIAAREEQIERFGHTAEADANAPAAHLPKLAGRYAMDAVEDLQFNRPRHQVIKKLERSAALALAAIALLSPDTK